MEKDNHSLKVLNSEMIEPDPTASGNPEDHDDSNTISEEQNENDQVNANKDEDKTGAIFSVVVNQSNL